VKRHRRITAAGLASVAGAITLAATGSGFGGGRATFAVTSTLSGKHVLPHRIHWLGKPTLPASAIREVDFLIDGKLSWVEHHSPYTYGYDGNYLVTSWMKPGLHSFRLVAVATNGRRASTISQARTPAPKPAPPDLAGDWHRELSAAEAHGSGPPGIWTLIIDNVGWRILDPTRRHGALIDVAYLSSNSLEARGGIATRNQDPRENNPWCDEPFEPVRYHSRVTARQLMLTVVPPKRCDGQSSVFSGTWTKR
jgi:hypothetical protein